jgi:hypothetical protein
MKKGKYGKFRMAGKTGSTGRFLWSINVKIIITFR